MEKILEKRKNKNSPKALGEIIPSKIKKLRIFGRLEEAFKSFDELDTEDKTQFVIQNEVSFSGATIKDMPPLPTEASVSGFLLRNALLLIDNGEFVLARHILGDLLRRQPYHCEAIRWMGWCFKQAGDYSSALKCYGQLRIHRKSDQDLYEMGEIYYELKQDAFAKDAWVEALSYCHSESPRLFDLHKNLGNSFMRLGDLESAEENYNKAFTLRPHSDALQVNLGSLHFYRRDFKKAFEAFKEAVDINPYNDRAWCGVSLVAREKKDFIWAKEMLLKSLDINSENLVSLQLLVQWSFEDRDFTNAIERVSVYSFQNQNDTSMIYTLAGLLFEAACFLESEMELERLLALEPTHNDAQELLEIICQKNNTTKDAK